MKTTVYIEILIDDNCIKHVEQNLLYKIQLIKNYIIIKNL